MKTYVRYGKGIQEMGYFIAFVYLAMSNHIAARTDLTSSTLNVFELHEHKAIVILLRIVVERRHHLHNLFLIPIEGAFLSTSSENRQHITYLTRYGCPSLYLL